MTDQGNTLGEKKKVHCVWVLAASPVWTPTHIEQLPAPDAVIAADGGSTLAAQLGRMPNIVVGDFDSSDPVLTGDLERTGVKLERYSHSAKWETDTELALLAAAEMNPDTIILLGAAGGRLDHSLANVLLLTHPRLAHIDVRLVDGRQVVLLAKPDSWNLVPARTGDTVSLLPVRGEAHGVRTDGLEYPLVDEALLPGRGRGVSNVAVQDNPSVYLESGTLLIVIVQKGHGRED